MEPEEMKAIVPPGNNMKKWIIGGVIVLALGYIGTQSAGWFGKQALKQAGVSVDQDGKSVTYEGKDGKVTVGSNALPDNWPSDAPTYKNATIQYAGTSNPQTGSAGSAVVFTTTDTVEQVSDFYKRELVTAGWSIEGVVNTGPATVVSAKKDNRTFGAYIANAGDGKVSVTVGIELPQ
jgi:hypothetical protein